MAKGKPLFKQSDIKRALDAARKMNVPVRSVDIKRDGSFSLVIGDPAATATANEVDEWMANKNAS